MEGELLGTIDNLSKVADSKSFGKLKVANVAKLFAGRFEDRRQKLKAIVL